MWIEGGMMKGLVLAVAMIGSSAMGMAQGLSGLCMLSAADRMDRLSSSQLMLAETDCGRDGDGCSNMNNSTVAWERWTGVSQQALQGAGATLTAKMTGEAGELECAGVVHDGVLSGRYRFTPDTKFVPKMAAMGFDGFSEHKQMSMLMLDVTTAWVKEMQGLGVTELTTTGKLISLRALQVDAVYVNAMKAAGYPELRAGKLTEMKAVGVTPEKVQEAKAMGFQPTEQELVQMAIFKIDRPFVERMRARGLGDLTLAKLIKIKIFKLD
jgi:hypothetical protein